VKLLSREKLVKKLKENKEFRDSFAMEFVKNSIPSQLRDLRDQRGWTQDELGKATKKPRNVITRLENPNNNIPNIYTMLEMAWGVDAALLVKIIPFSELLKEYENSDPERFFIHGINDEKEVAELSKYIDQDTADSIESLVDTKALLAKILNANVPSSTTAKTSESELDFALNSSRFEFVNV
jgi:putative transcriptional regulator